MAKHKKSELDAILEQLKQSYATDADLDLEDSLLETEKSEEDAELASALEKIFASNISDQVIKNTEESPIEEQLSEENAFEDMIPEIVEDIETVEEESCKDVQDVQSKEKAEIHEELSEEEEIVEDVLSLMLNPRREADNVESNTSEENEEDTSPQNDAGAAALLSIIENEAENTETDFEPLGEAEDSIIEAENDSEVADEIEDSNCDSFEEEIDFSDTDVPVDEIDTANDEETIVAHEEDSINAQQSEVSDISESDVNSTFEIDESEYEDEAQCEIIDDLFESVPPKRIVLSPEEYTYDELQLTLDSLEFFKPKNDITFNNNNINAAVDIIEEDDVIEASVEQNDNESDAFVDNVSENDISLMLKFGYRNEISSEVGVEKTNKVILNKNEKFVPDKYKIIHGFNGKEFSTKAQIHGIKKKYKRDIISLWVLAIVISVFAMVSLLLDIGVVFADDPSYFTGIIITELIMALVIGFITWRRLLSGVIGIIKFDTNTYSVAAMALFEFALYSLVMSFIYALSPDILANAVKASFGGYVFMFVGMTVFAELFDCLRGSMTFDMMVDNDSHYVTEKHAKLFEVKRSNYVSGYFAKMNAGKPFDVSIIFMIGGFPILAIIVGVVTSILRDDVSVGAVNTALILFISIPVTATLTASLIEFINAVKLKGINTAFLGADAAAQHSALSELVFNDTEAVETVSFTEINPSKNAANAKKWLNISYSVLDALGGPFYLSLLRQRGESDANISHDITINSISDNGIDLHFNSSLNVLIGDKQYMNANNIKVKTDTGLTTAAKGTERSVIYFAFDGVPQIAFIISSKIKPSFNDCLNLLQSNDIKLAVKSYEPEINETFFDANLEDGAVRVIKTVAYERYTSANMAETNVISSSPVELCHAVIYSRTIMDDRRSSNFEKTLKAIIGFISVCLVCVFMCTASDGGIITALQQGISIICYLAMLLSMIPDVVRTVKMSKRNIKDKE